MINLCNPYQLSQICDKQKKKKKMAFNHGIGHLVAQMQDQQSSNYATKASACSWYQIV